MLAHCCGHRAKFHILVETYAFTDRLQCLLGSLWGFVQWRLLWMLNRDPMSQALDAPQHCVVHIPWGWGRSIPSVHWDTSHGLLCLLTQWFWASKQRLCPMLFVSILLRSSTGDVSNLLSRVQWGTVIRCIRIPSLTTPILSAGMY